MGGVNNIPLNMRKTLLFKYAVEDSVVAFTEVYQIFLTFILQTISINQNNSAYIM